MPEIEQTGGERLQKILANAGVSSRRSAEALIRAGRVTVNGKVVTEMGVKADPAHDRVELDGRLIRGASVSPDTKKVYIALNKPKGIVTTAKDTHGRPTVLDLLAPARLSAKGIRVYPVGRLDADSTGLLLLTNDGDLTFRLTHPRYGVEKEYLARVRGRPGRPAIERLREGVEIEGGKTAPAFVTEVGAEEGNALLKVIIHEGQKRQVRQMCLAVGHPVIELKRVRFGPLALGDLEEGKWRYLAVHEVHALRKVVKLKATEIEAKTPTGGAARGKEKVR